jgi:hypothetical protein
VTNRITNHLPQPDPEPEKNGGDDLDLTKGELSKLPEEGTDDMAKAGLPQEKWSRSYGRFGLCVRSNSAGDTYPKDECRRTRL